MADFAQFAFKDEVSGAQVIPPEICYVQNVNIKAKEIIKDKEDDNGESHKHGLGDLFFSPYHVENTLRLLIVGHNPSEKSWQRGHYYANPANRMWSLLRLAKIVPSTFIHDNDIDCPSKCGVGFTDLMTGIPETKSSTFSLGDIAKWKKSLYHRIESHVIRVSRNLNMSLVQSCPKVIAFAGVRQWKALFPPNYNFKSDASATSSMDDFLIHDHGTKRKYPQLEEENQLLSEKSTFGVQSVRPPDWPKALGSCKVFVLPSSSGAAALTNAEREVPYIALGHLINEMWPIETWNQVISVPGRHCRMNIVMVTMQSSIYLLKTSIHGCKYYHIPTIIISRNKSRFIHHTPSVAYIHTSLY